MDVVYGLMPAMVILGLLSVAVFFWAVRNGQYDDMDGAAHRILDDDDLPGQRQKAAKKIKQGKPEIRP